MVTDGKFLWQRLDELTALLDSLMNKIDLPAVCSECSSAEIEFVCAECSAEADSPELSHTQIHERLLEIKKYIEEMK